MDLLLQDELADLEVVPRLKVQKIHRPNRPGQYLEYVLLFSLLLFGVKLCILDNVLARFHGLMFMYVYIIHNCILAANTLPILVFFCVCGSHPY